MYCSTDVNVYGNNNNNSSKAIPNYIAQFVLNDFHRWHFSFLSPPPSPLLINFVVCQINPVLCWKNSRLFTSARTQHLPPSCSAQSERFTFVLRAAPVPSVRRTSRFYKNIVIRQKKMYNIWGFWPETGSHNEPIRLHMYSEGMHYYKCRHLCMRLAHCAVASRAHIPTSWNAFGWRAFGDNCCILLHKRKHQVPSVVVIVVVVGRFRWEKWTNCNIECEKRKSHVHGQCVHHL